MENSNIQWTNHTFNPWEGCTKVSPGCLHCYAETRNIRWAGGANWGKGAPRRRTSASNWKEPVKWNKAAGEKAQLFGNMPWARAALDEATPRRPRVFCASLADWLDDEVDIDWLVDLLDLVRTCTNLDWLLLTKRPENWRVRLAAALDTRDVLNFDNDPLAQWLATWLGGDPPANVWIGTTAEDQPRCDERVKVLLYIPARIRFLSVEPMLGPIFIKDSVYSAGRLAMDEGWGINWVICGGESGPGARPFVAEWADQLRRECKTAGVAFFMKQMGSNPVTSNANVLDWPDHVEFHEPRTQEAGFAAARVVLKDRGHGGDMEEFPEEIRIREFPV